MSIMDDIREAVDAAVYDWFSDAEGSDEGCAFCGCILSDDELQSGQCHECRISG